MSYFVYNDTSSQKFGVLERCPIPPQAEEQYESVQVLGRTEALLRPRRHRPDIELPLVLGIKDMRKLRECYQWLTGTGELILSSRPHEKYRVKRIKTTPEYVSRRFGKISITFTVSPYTYAVADEPIDLTDCTAQTSIMNEGMYSARPRIEFLLTKEEDAVLMGDVDQDGFITAQDAVKLQIAVTSGNFDGWTDEQLRAADMTGDGQYDARDVARILQRAAETGTVDAEGTPYDVYIHINGRVMRVSVPQECSMQQLPVTIDCENEIVYYTNVKGKKVNILDRTYGELPRLDTGENSFYYTTNIPMRRMTLKKNERW